MKAKNNDNSSLIATFMMTALLLLVWWGMENTEVALFLIEHPVLILPYLFEKLVAKFGYLKLFLVVFVVTFIAFFLLLKPRDRDRLSKHNKNVIRGAKVIPTRQLKAILKKQSRLERQPQLEIAGLPIPARLENRGFFMFGSPGTGKTQAISQMTAIIRQRSDFRAIIFDRNGEMLEKFYDPTLDIIFNPFDVRSHHWCHIIEAASPETIAAGLIPLESTKEPFFSTAARAIMAELFCQTRTNQELWELLNSDTATLSSFLSSTLAARYLGEEKVATSVLSTVANYCGFYAALVQPRNKAIGFYNWARSDNRSWIFVTLRENESELLRPLHSLVFELMLNGLLSNKNPSMKTAIIIDELGALNQLPSLHRLLSESRQYQGCPILGTQTEAQIIERYGLQQTRTILQGTKTKLILGCADPQTAETMAKVIGRQEYRYLTENQSRSRHTGRSGNGRTDGFNEQLREAYAVMPDELANLPDLRGYLKIDLYCAPIKLKLKKFLNRARSFVSIPNKDLRSIEEQWQDFEE